jgi:hypothetical protein
MLLVTKVFMSLWFGLLASVSITALVSMLAAPTGKPGRFWLVLGPLRQPPSG